MELVELVVVREHIELVVQLRERIVLVGQAQTERVRVDVLVSAVVVHIVLALAHLHIAHELDLDPPSVEPCTSLTVHQSLLEPLDTL
jgi:hypothetical protein